MNTKADRAELPAPTSARAALVARVAAYTCLPIYFFDEHAEGLCFRQQEARA